MDLNIGVVALTAGASSIMGGLVGMFFARVKKGEPINAEESRKIARQETLEIRQDLRKLSETLLHAVNRQDEKLAQLMLQLLAKNKGD